MSTPVNEISLMTFMAVRRDPLFLENVIYALERDYHFSITKVYYLVDQPKDPSKDRANRLQEKMDKLESVKAHFKDAPLEIEPIFLEIDNPSNHPEVLGAITAALKPRLHQMGPIAINISGGTPAMYSAWMTLNATGFFSNNARVFNVQKVAPYLFSINHEQVVSGQIVDILKEELEKAILKGDIVEITASMIARKEDITTREELPASFGDYSYGIEDNSEALKTPFEKLTQYCFNSSMPVLILGEKGVGKSKLMEDVICKHKKSRDTQGATFSKEPFTKELFAINCGTLNPKTAYPEIFGAAKGAYTGATGKRTGLVESAKGNIIFMDEIHHLDKEIQRTLLRTLQEPSHPYRRMGEVQEQHSPGTKFIFATNKSLPELREYLDPDFFDRISSHVVKLPPLRECKANIRQYWNQVWTQAVKTHTSYTGESAELIPTEIWNDQLQAFFNDDANLQGNFRSLERVAHNILVNTHWEKHGQCNPAVINQVLKEAEELNRQGDAAKPAAFQPSSQQAEDLVNQFIGMDWKEANQKFRQILAQKAIEKYNGAAAAARAMNCNEKMLRQNKKNS